MCSGKKYIFLNNIQGNYQKSVNWDVADYDENDSDLQISEIEKENYEREALHKVTSKMIESILKIAAKD
ncbi:MAG: hypothetical protein KAR38_04090 [Calditrichia bacterium]|nr:hypothetical protein [Calditrichia bacterium]